mmetsp:Transcript_397/g.910  ORF Transcript_397/g.910 Transcript_397/m.910 type:complete len:216 (-) Transcript_397:240-887(-)
MSSLVSSFLARNKLPNPQLPFTACPNEDGSGSFAPSSGGAPLAVEVRKSLSQKSFWPVTSRWGARFMRTLSAFSTMLLLLSSPPLSFEDGSYKEPTRIDRMSFEYAKRRRFAETNERFRRMVRIASRHLTLSVGRLLFPRFARQNFTHVLPSFVSDPFHAVLATNTGLSSAPSSSSSSSSILVLQIHSLSSSSVLFFLLSCSLSLLSSGSHPITL